MPGKSAATVALLCERCGYGLTGLDPNTRCPECGEPIAESSPQQRIGPAWQNQMNLTNGFVTAANVVLQPSRLYRTMRLDGPNLPARLFLTTIGLIVGVGWGLFAAFGLRQGFLVSWIQGMAAVKLVLLMTYIETMGVTFFSKRRKWRVPFRLAERVTCYASVGWIIAAVVVAGLMMLAGDGRAEALAQRWVGRWEPSYGFLLGAVAFGAAVIGFELLVYTGVRQVRFANPPHATTGHPSTTASDIKHD